MEAKRAYPAIKGHGIKHHFKYFLRYARKYITGEVFTSTKLNLSLGRAEPSENEVRIAMDGAENG